METNKESLPQTPVSFKEILSDYKIVIPKIQRDYAQGRETEQKKRDDFLTALAEAAQDESGKKLTLDFIYGNKKQNGGNSIAEIIPLDGQQRLTTLFLLHWYAAKKQNIDEKFLKNFTYETRPSSRDFCEKLAEFSPSFKERPSADIQNQEWFPLSWKKDPTIKAMLTMLDAIHLKFKNIDGLYEKLDKINFYFLPVENIGDSDDLYIKMNSRGKPLTDFELLKSELEAKLEPRTETKEIGRRVIKKIDNEWTDLLWIYSGKDGQIDDKFLNYFKFVYKVICYKNNSSPQQNHDIDVLINCFAEKENLEILEKYLDCFGKENLKQKPEEFFDSFINKKHISGKIIYEDNADIFEDCLNNKTFTLKKTIYLYAVIIYLNNNAAVSEKDFKRRIRIISNLIKNSDDEISDRTNKNRMPAILEQTEYIILNGKIKENIKLNFNKAQLDEETEKIEFLKNNPDSAEKIFELEDHPLLYGQIGIIGAGNAEEYMGRFQSLFPTNLEGRYLDKISRALMATGNYIQQEHPLRYKHAAEKENIWQNLFHKSHYDSEEFGFENTKNVLSALLGKKAKNETFDDNFLDDIVKNYLGSCEKLQEFPFQYYYVKYGEFRQGNDGKLYNNTESQYLFTVLWKSSLSENAYDPFLKAAANKTGKAEMIDRNAPWYGRRILLANGEYIQSKKDKFIHYKQDKSIFKEIPISQNKNGLDTQDRIEVLTNYLSKII